MAPGLSELLSNTATDLSEVTRWAHFSKFRFHSPDNVSIPECVPANASVAVLLLLDLLKEESLHVVKAVSKS